MKAIFLLAVCFFAATSAMAVEDSLIQRLERLEAKDRAQEAEIARLQKQVTDNAAKIDSNYFFEVWSLNEFSVQGSPLPFINTALNVGGAMNTTSGLFQAPENGWYSFSFTGRNTAAATSNIELRVNNIIYIDAYANAPANTQFTTISFTAVVEMTAGQFAFPFLYTGKIDYYYFSGYLIATDAGFTP